MFPFDDVIMYRVNATTADNLAHQGARSSAGMTLPHFPWHIHYNDVIMGGVSNHRRLDCLLNRLFRRRSKKISKLLVTGILRGIHRSPSQRASNADYVSIWWRHHASDLVYRNVRNVPIYIETMYLPLNNSCILCLCYCPSGKTAADKPLLAWQYIYIYSIYEPKGIFVES